MRNAYRTKQQLCALLINKQNGEAPAKSASSAMFLQFAKNHTSLGNLSKGRGAASDGRTLTCAYAIAQAFRGIGLGADLADELDAAQSALRSLRERAASTGSWTLKGPELTALNLGMEVCDAQLDVCTVAELELAVDAAVAAMIAAIIDEVPK